MRTDGADAFFTAIEEKVTSLKELPAGHPLTGAAASVKRYVAEPHHRIRLHDLLAEEAASVAQRLDAELPVQGEPRPSEDELRRRMALIDSATGTLRAMFFHVALWGGPEHRAILVRALRATIPKQAGGGYTMSLNLQGYLAALLLYAAGMGAVAGSNFGALGALLDMRYRVTDTTERP